MVFERDVWRMGSGSPQRALAELDKGYKMIRAWLTSQMPPEDMPTAAAPPEPEKRVSSRRPAVDEVDVPELR